MEESTSKEKVLKNIRNALLNEAENPFPHVDFTSSIYEEIEDSLDVTFAEEFTKVAGKFVYCENEADFIENYQILSEQNNWPVPFCFEENFTDLLKKSGLNFSSREEDLNLMKVGITGCECLIARLGSIMVSSKLGGGRKMNAFAEIHIVVAYTSQLVPDLKHGFSFILNKYSKKLPSMISVITGPSRSADIEKKMIMGMHGPRELYLFLIDDSE